MECVIYQQNRSLPRCILKIVTQQQPTSIVYSGRREVLTLSPASDDTGKLISKSCELQLKYVLRRFFFCEAAHFL